MQLKERIEDEVHLTLIGMGLNSSTKSFVYLKAIICDMVWDPGMNPREKIYHCYAERFGVSYAILDRSVTYLNGISYKRQSKTYQDIFSYYGGDATVKRKNYEFLKTIASYIRNSLYDEWDEENQLEIVVNNYLIKEKVIPSSKGFYLIKDAILLVIEKEGEVLSSDKLFKGGQLNSNITSCSRALNNVQTSPQQFIYEMAYKISRATKRPYKRVLVG